MADLFENVWGTKKEIVVDHAIDVTLPVSLSCRHRIHVPNYVGRSLYL